MIIAKEKYKDTYIVYIDERKERCNVKIHSAMEEWYKVYPALSTDVSLGLLLDKIRGNKKIV